VLCMLAGGWLSDRLRPRRLMLIADTLRLLLMGGLAALAFGGHPLLWQLCAIAVPLGALGGAFIPASMSMVPDILGKDDLQAGNGLMMASMQGANLIGSSIAGVIVAGFTSAVALALDAGTFLVSAISLALMRGPNTPPLMAVRQKQARNSHRSARRKWEHRSVSGNISRPRG
jgi:MFS family permease